jgi:hypothetical protein
MFISLFIAAAALLLGSGVTARTTSHEKLIGSYEGPKTCAQCHAGVAEDVVHSVHYKLKGPVSTVQGLTGEWGESNRECGLPGSIYALNSSCKQCHIGNGTAVTDKPTEREREGIDCLICHAAKYDYSKRAVVPTTDTPEGYRVTQDRSVEAARTVGAKPSSEACLRCHYMPAGGPWWKRGINFSPERDVHVAKGMICVDCHKAEKHKFANGNDPGGWAKEATDRTLNCESCHAGVKHKNPAVSSHLTRISCTVCHIPTIGGVVTRDYVNLVTNPKTGMYMPKADPFDSTYSTKPTYRFFNGTANQEIEPIGSVNDPKSKITAFKPLTTIAPRDAKTKKLLFQNLAVLFKTGSVDQALAQGFKQRPQEYSGTWEPVSITGYFILSHDIAKTKALNCAECHSDKNYIGFDKLGYSPDRVKQLTNQSYPRYR